MYEMGQFGWPTLSTQRGNCSLEFWPRMLLRNSDFLFTAARFKHLSIARDRNLVLHIGENKHVLFGLDQ